ncbi:MAG: hypothetical protein ACE5ID_06430, partial [Acidobacteriota bacterium]
EAAGLLLRLAGQHAAAAFLRWPAAALALLVAGYTAFLFGQCQGRNLWQSRLLLPHLLAQAALCGAACYLPLAPGSAGLRFIFIFSAAVHLIFSLLERFRRRASVNAAQAAAFLGSLRLGPAGRSGTACSWAAWPPLVWPCSNRPRRWPRRSEDCSCTSGPTSAQASFRLSHEPPRPKPQARFHVGDASPIVPAA